ncbi:MAG: hypothetical protein K2H34_03170, partial [Lachnospiraceae bacterium]|nr:hypothetical protein [Lachnospiraceae bacterium]
MAFSNEDMIDVILSMNNVLVMYWDVHHGWKIVNGNSMFFSGMESIPNALEGLSQYVLEEDKATYRVFWRKIEAG